MREISCDEASLVAGGDDVDYNAVACNTAISAGVAASGFIYGASVATSGAVLGISGTELCQAGTTYLGDAIGASIASMEESISSFSSQWSYSVDLFNMYMKWDTMGL